MAEMFTFLKRRFSSGDLQGELADKREQEGLPSFLNFNSNQSGQSGGIPTQGQSNTTRHPYHTRTQSTVGGSTQNYQRYNTQSHHTTELPNAGSIDPQRPFNQSSGMQSSVGNRKGAYPSAPSSPSKSRTGFMSNSQHQDNGGSSFMAPMGSITRGIFSAASNAANTVRDKAALVTGAKCKLVLIIDDANTDWAKYFRGRKVGNDYDVRVEQAALSELTLSAHTDQGCVCNIHTNQGRPVKTFKPDFVLLREHITGPKQDWQAILNGFMFGGVPTMNSLASVYNMKNRSWLMNAPGFPSVLKLGDGHYGEGKMRVDNLGAFQDVASLVGMANTYVTVEPLIDAKCTVKIQKIGRSYKAFSRKSISGAWKSNVGSSMIEKTPVNERFKLWIEEFSRLFGGLEICSIDAVQSKTGEYYIYGAHGSDITLLGDGQDEDRREIAELVLQRLNSISSLGTMSKTPSMMSVTGTLESSMTSNQPASGTVPPSPAMGGGLFANKTPMGPTSINSSATPSQNSYQATVTTSTSSFSTQSLSRNPPASTTTFTPNQSSSLFADKTPMNKPPAPTSTSSVGWTPQSSTPITSSFAPMKPAHPPPISSRAFSTSSTMGDSMSNDGSIGSSATAASTTSASATGGSLFGQTTMATTSSLFDQKNKQMSPGLNNVTGMSSALPITSTTSSTASSSSTFTAATTAGIANQPPMSATTTAPPSVKPSRPPGEVTRPPLPTRQPSTVSSSGVAAVGATTNQGSVEDADDTMKNLRKTFAGIFGDM